MKKKISEYTLRLLLLTSSWLIGTASGWGQQVHKAVPAEKKAEMEKEAEKNIPLYQGLSVEWEIAGLASHLLGSDILNSEVALRANLKNKFLPVVEIGYGKADAINDGNDLHYKTAAPYFRIGVDYNIFHKKTQLPGYIYAGVRYGMSSFSFDVNGPDMTDPNYGGLHTIPYSYSGLKSNASWAEGVFGLKVKIYKGFCMGWSVRYKIRVSVKNHENAVPWYVPGFGKNASSSFNLMYNLIYNLPF